MAKGAYVGVDGVAHKVKKIYTGVDNVAKQVKKGYVGVGGVARPFFSSDGLEYYGAITPLSVARANLAATTVGNYALFGGGSENNYEDTVDAYVDSVGAEIPSYLTIDEGEGDYDLIDLIDGTITKISKEYSDFLTLKRGHAYMFALSDPDLSMWKKIKRIEASVFSDSGSIDYECNGAVGYSRDTIYIAPNISVPTGDPEDLPILTIVVYFSIV